MRRVALPIVVVAVLVATRAEAQSCRADFAAELATQAITDVQRELSAHGYRPGRADGRLGKQTCGAVLAYQRDAGWTPDGRVDVKLQNHLHFGQPRVEARRR